MRTISITPEYVSWRRLSRASNARGRFAPFGLTQRI